MNIGMKHLKRAKESSTVAAAVDEAELERQKQQRDFREKLIDNLHICRNLFARDANGSGQ